jgi:hypothetical protein
VVLVALVAVAQAEVRITTLVAQTAQQCFWRRVEIQVLQTRVVAEGVAVTHKLPRQPVLVDLAL